MSTHAIHSHYIIQLCSEDFHIYSILVANSSIYRPIISTGHCIIQSYQNVAVLSNHINSPLYYPIMSTAHCIIQSYQHVTVLPYHINMSLYYPIISTVYWIIQSYQQLTGLPNHINNLSINVSTCKNYENAILQPPWQSLVTNNAKYT